MAMDSKKKNSGYQTRLFVVISCFTWILTFAFFVLLCTREKVLKIENLNSQLQLLNTEILEEISYDGNIERFKSRKTIKVDSVRVTLIDFSGNILFDTHVNSL